MTFVIGEDAVAAILDQSFVGGIDYVYVQQSDGESLLTPVSKPAWFQDASTFSVLTLPEAFDGYTLYGGHARLDTPRSLTPWTMQLVTSGHVQRQYNRVMASVVRSGVYCPLRRSFLQTGVRMSFPLTDTSPDVLPLIASIRDEDTMALLQVKEATVSTRDAFFCDRLTMFAGDTDIDVHLCEAGGQLSCSAIFSSSTIYGGQLTAVGTYVKACAAARDLQAHSLTAFYPVVVVPLDDEDGVLSMCAAGSAH